MKNTLFYSGEFDEWFEPNIFFKKGKLVTNFDDGLDQRINTYLFGIDAEETKSFVLPISITGNFYDFSGLTFAHHIRLTRNINCCDVTIVFYGTLELEQLLRLTPLARILLTVNVLYVNIAKYTFDAIQASIEKYKPKEFSLCQFLEQIQIKPPSNYDSRHSIANEFALIQWSKYIKCFDIIPEQFKKEFDSQLYFKYLSQKHSSCEINDQKQFTISTKENTKILLVDDEANKGWMNFYKSFLKKSNIEFEDSGIEFKIEEKGDLIAKVESKVTEFNPDVVLLDLRLHDSDFDEEAVSENLTGIKILETIKGINKGIQVIITTASNKAWNLNLAKQKGAFDFIIKDGFDSPDKSVRELSSAIEIATKRAFFLKGIGRKIAEVKNLIISNNYFDYKNDEIKIKQEKKDKVRKKLFSNLDLAFELLDLSYEVQGKQKYFAYSYLQFFICIEEFLGIKEIFEFGDKCYVNNTILIAQKDPDNALWTSSIKFIKGNHSYYIMEKDGNNPSLNPSSTDFKMSSVLIYLFKQDDSRSENWPQIRDIRNQKAAHPEKENVIPNDINQLLDFLAFIFNKDKLNLESKKKGLPNEVRQEDLEKLKNTFNKRQ